MKFKQKTYGDKKYIEYSDEDKGLLFTNAEFFIFDIRSEAFQDIMQTTGGFVANMTTRFIKTQKLDTVTHIMLCCVPQEYNDYVFDFVYLDKDQNIITSLKDNNYFDYAYFKQKFKDCITKEGMIYELEGIESLKELTKQFHQSPSVDFNFKIDGKAVHFEDTLLCHDLSFFREDFEKNLKKLHAQAALLHFECDSLNFITLKGKVIDEDENPFLYYQVRSGTKDKTECVKRMQKKYEDYTEKDICDEEFEFDMNLQFAKTLADKMEFFISKKELELPDITDDYEER